METGWRKHGRQDKHVLTIIGTHQKKKNNNNKYNFIVDEKIYSKQHNHRHTASTTTHNSSTQQQHQTSNMMKKNNPTRPCCMFRERHSGYDSRSDTGCNSEGRRKAEGPRRREKQRMRKDPQSGKKGRVDGGEADYKRWSVTTQKQWIATDRQVGWWNKEKQNGSHRNSTGKWRKKINPRLRMTRGQSKRA